MLRSLKKLPIWLKFAAIFTIIFTSLRFAFPDPIVIFPIFPLMFLPGIVILFISLVSRIFGESYVILGAAMTIMMSIFYLLVGSLIGRIYQQYTGKDKNKRNWRSLPPTIKVIAIIYFIILIFIALVWIALPSGFAP